MFILPPPPPRWPAPDNRSYDNYASRTVEPAPGPNPGPPGPPEPPPPVYTAAPLLNRVPSYTFTVEEPPPYSPIPKDSHGGRGSRRVLGIKLSNMAAVLALFIAGAVIVGGIYGYQNRGPGQTNATTATPTSNRL